MLRFALLALLAAPAFGAEPVTAIAYHPGGNSLAVGQGGRVVLFEAAGKPVASLDGIPGRITAIAYSNDGTHLAVAAGVAGQSGLVDVYAVGKDGSPGERLLRFPKAHSDAIYGMVFSPDGKTLATTGYDRLIHLWKVDAKTREPHRVLKDHSDAVYSLAFHPQGKLLASAAADSAVKVWNVEDGTRLYTLSEPTDWLYAVTWSPDGRHLAAGGVDRSIHVWSADAAGGKLVKSAFAHERPVTRLAYSRDGQTLFSLGEDRVIKVWNARTLQEERVFPAQPESVLAFAVRPDGKHVAVGRHDGVAEILDAVGKKLIALPLGHEKTSSERFPTVTEVVAETESALKAMSITLPVTILGALDRPGDVDYFRFEAKAGDQIGVQALPLDGSSKLEPALTMTDESGRVLAEGTANLGIIATTDGRYSISLRDRDYQGGPDRKYRLRVGPLPVVTGIFPLGATRGRSSPIQLRGVNLGANTSVNVAIPADAEPGSRIPIKLPTTDGDPILGMPSVVVDEFPSVAVPPSGRVKLEALPATADGVLANANEAHTIHFAAKKGQRLAVEVNARRLGSPLDSAIEICDRDGKPIPLAVLRSTSKTFTTLRDHDAEKPGIRLETWHDFRMDDYLYADGELLRILDLPRGPDNDCDFYQVNGKRLGYLGTTPTFHPYGVTMYRVEVHPPGSTFPPNGMPVFTLFQRNDDGGPGLGADSKLLFDPPADGEYQVRIRDSRGMSGPGFAYRVTVRPPKPDFTVRFSPSAPEVRPGEAVPVTVTVDRLDGFAGPIEVSLKGLPAGVEAPGTTIPGNLNTTTLALSATATAREGRMTAPLRLTATAVIDGTPITHESVGKPLVLTSTIGDLTTRVRDAEVVIRLGQESRFTVSIERRNGFKGRVPITIAGLPHGVRVLNVGLNGILITERDTSREVVLYAEPWVKPAKAPFVVFAKREGKNTEHAAPAVVLKVK